jgi:hypothetical protein
MSTLRLRVMLSVVAAIVLATVASACGGSKTMTAGAATRSAEGTVAQLRSDSPSTVKHFSIGTSHGQSLALSLGFDVMDISGSHTSPRATKSRVDALPRGVEALISVVNLDNTDCARPAYSNAQFRALVDALANDPKVYGYYISDEPHPLTCRNAAADIRARADYLHAHSSSQKAFIVISDGSNTCGSALGCEYRALKPAITHVDLVGLDPYPCHYSDGGQAAPCDYGMINQRVAAAIASGIPANDIVPVFQTFGQEHRVGGPVYYRTPTPGELITMLNRWHSLIPNPVMDYAYTFGVQCSITCPSPQALLNHPELRTVIRAHNR